MERFDAPVVTVGGHPTCELPFDLRDEFDDKARNAEPRLKTRHGGFATLAPGEAPSRTAPHRLGETVREGGTIFFDAYRPSERVQRAGHAGTEVEMAAEARRWKSGLRRSVVHGAVVAIVLSASSAVCW